MKRAILALMAALALAACAPATPEPDPTEPPTETPEEETPEPTPTVTIEEDGEGGPVQIRGEVEVSNALILQVYFNQRFVYLQDLTGFIMRDYEYEQPVEGQILGPVLVDETAGTFEYVLNLPAQPITPLNDVDFDEEEEEGVAVWQVVMDANLLDDPFLKEDETGGWASVYTSAVIDSENRNEIAGGTLVIWAPDDEQSFPSGFGDDGLLFTGDDPVEPVPAGYSLIDLSAEPFEVIRDEEPDVTLLEGDIQVNDLSDLSWTEAFDALWEQASTEYPFTEEKDIDWDALYDEFAPRIAEAEDAGDGQAYYNALQEFAWSIPDGHVGLNGNDFGRFQQEIAGGYGFTLVQLSDGRVITGTVLADSDAQAAGIEPGTEIVTWNEEPIEEALAAVVPFSAPFSNPEAERVQQLRYLVRDPLGTEVEIGFLNAGGAEQTVTLEAQSDQGETFNSTSVFAGFDSSQLPVEHEILDSGYGYIKINTLSDDLFLTIRLWEVALERLQQAAVPGIIIDLRQNTGGAPIGTLLASYFYDGPPIDIANSYYFSEESGEFETFGPPDRLEPNDDFTYDGLVAVLVSTACSSACEDVAYTFGLLDQTRVFGFYSTNGIFGEVGRGQYVLPAPDAQSPPYSFQIPTGVALSPEGEILIEGPGVVPDVRVPLTEETVEAQFIEGEDVVLNFATEVLDQPLGAGVEPEGSPTADSSADLIGLLQAQVPILENLAREEYEELSQPGETYTYTIPLRESQDVIWTYIWCGTDEETVTQNWENIDLSFTLNGEAIPREDFAETTLPLQDGTVCQIAYTLLSEWPAGEHTLSTEVTFTTAINDGTDDYAAGTHTFEYSVFIAP